MRIAFRLVNDKSRDFINCLIKNQELELLCFVDGNENKWGEVDCESGIPYISPYKFLDMYEKNKVDKIVISPYSGAYTALDVANEMISMGIPTEAILLPAIPDIDEKEEIRERDLVQFKIENYKTLPRIQYHIADHCNLNCASCTHFSSLVKEEVFISSEEVQRDLMALKKIVKHVERIDILGGEPFLNKNWREYIKITHDIYKFSEITIITNGTLIWKMSDDDWKYIRDNDVCFRMSLYKPFWKKADEIVSFLKEKKVKYNVNLRVISEFAYAFLKERRCSSTVNRMNCRMECNQLYHGKMTPCSIMMYIKYFNDYWGTNFSEDVSVEDLCSVKNFNELVKLLNRPMDICEYCNVELRSQIFAAWETMKYGGKENNDINKWIYQQIDS